MITGVFRDRTAAQATYQWLLDQGYAASELNVLMSDKTRSSYAAEEDHEDMAHAGNQAVEGMAIGGAVGTAVGAGLAALAALGTSIVLPGLGLIVAGPLAAAFAGGGAAPSQAASLAAWSGWA